MSTTKDLPAGWRIAPVDTNLAQDLEKKGISPLLAALLVRRGVKTSMEAEEFLHPDFEHLHPAGKMPGMNAAVERLLKALDRQERILVYGDYDVDGITAAALLVTALRRLGAQAEVLIPRRLEEGYGFHLQPVLSKEHKPDLVVTVDCGISDREEICRAGEQGIDVIVTDHHEPLDIPAAVAVVNPKLPGSLYPWRELAGAGVTFKLADCLCRAANYPEATEDLIDLAALGTVADVVPLLGENRTIVSLGLKAMNRGCRPGLAALRETAGKKGELTVGEIAFQIAPRLNAAGRLGDGRHALELLLAENFESALPGAALLQRENSRRQQLQERVVAEACQCLQENPDLARGAIVLAGEDWHPGVIGIAASRLVEVYHRPAILISLEGEQGKGSGRSLPGFPLHTALEDCAPWLSRYGGHALAAGISLPRGNIEGFRKQLQELACAAIGPQGVPPVVQLEAELPADAVNKDTLRQLQLLEPYGMGNPRALFLTGPWLCKNWKQIGSKKEHLIMEMKQGDNQAATLYFNSSFPELPPLKGRKMLLAATLQEDTIRGGACLNVKEMAPDDCRQEGSLKVVDARFLAEEMRVGYLRELAVQEQTAVLVNSSVQEQKLKALSIPEGVFILQNRGLKRVQFKHLVLWDIPLMPENLAAALAVFPRELAVHLLYNQRSLADNRDLLAATVPQADTLKIARAGINKGNNDHMLQSYMEKKLGRKVPYALVEKCITILVEAQIAAGVEDVSEHLQRSTTYCELTEKISRSRAFQQELLNNGVEVIVKVYNTLT